MSLIYQQYVREQFNPSGEVVGFDFVIPERFNFAYDVVDRIAQEDPQRRALVWCSEQGEEYTFTFADMSQQSDRAAAMFLSMGVQKGDTVMLILKRHYEFWFCMLALHKIGAIAVPATNQLMLNDLLYRFEQAQISAIVCTAQGNISAIVDQACQSCPQVRTRIIARGRREGWVNFDEAMQAAAPFTRPTGDAAPTNSDTMFIYFSSGTAGMPKMVAHDYTYPLGHIPTAVYWQNVRPGKLHLTISETGWAKALWGKLYGQWLGEAVVFVYDFDRFHADAVLEAIQRHKVATLCAPPTIYRFLIKEDLSRFDLSSLEYAVIAGEALNPEVYNRFRELTGLKLMEGFGQTETTLTVANWRWMQPKPGSMGLPSPAWDVFIDDGQGNSITRGEVGEICIRVGHDQLWPGMFKHYFRDEHKTAQTWHDGIYHTGDTAWQDEDGYIWYVGRLDDIIKSSGYRIGPFEVESVIMEHPAVLECAVTGVDDPQGTRGTVIKATILLAKGYQPSDELAREIQNYVKTHTAPYKYPRVVQFVSELPKTISGKIRRMEIRSQDGQ